METKLLEIGTVYYQVTFADPELKIPCVEPMRYVGENLFPKHETEGATAYYFRSPSVGPGQGHSDEEQPGYYVSDAAGLAMYCTLIEAVAKLSLVAAGVDLTRPPGRRGLDL